MGGNLHNRKLNRDLLIGWAAIVIILFVTYVGEVLKLQRSLEYLAKFSAITIIPALICIFIYRNKKDWYPLRYFIIVGYFMMYTFVMLTGSTRMVFSYILPLLSFLVLYHQPRLIIYTGVGSLLLNLTVIAIDSLNGAITVETSKDAEIQIAVLVVCFAGSYVATRIYDSITKENIKYLKLVDEKNAEIQRMALQTITTIANTIDAKDEYTQGHSKRVSEYSYAIAKELGLNEDEATNIRFVALLHDIGKIGIPDSVLNKPGKLTDQEFYLMKQHTVIGADILKDTKTLEGIDVGAKYHHERFDGRGYPEGLKGEEIPYVARIIGVCDAYDAMTSNRVYRKKLSEDVVMSEIVNGSGKQFDPECAKALITLINENRLPSVDTFNDSLQMEETSKILSRILEKQESHLSDDAYLDELTRTYVRTYGESMLENEFKDHSGCFMIIDVDHLRQINEQFGFVFGDLCLTTMAASIRKSDQDFIVRYGGDKFAVWIRNLVDKDEADAVVDSMIQSIYKSFQEKENLDMVTVSAGIVLISANEKPEVVDVFENAEKALYQSKENGGNGYKFYRNISNDTKLSKVDLVNLIKLIRDENSYEGGFEVSYPEFGMMFEYIKKIAIRNDQRVQLLMYTVLPLSEQNVSVEEQEEVMNYLELAIVHSIRGVDITTRYSSTQRIVLLMNTSEEQIHIVTERIAKEFYKMYSGRKFSLYNDSVDLLDRDTI